MVPTSVLHEDSNPPGNGWAAYRVHELQQKIQKTLDSKASASSVAPSGYDVMLNGDKLSSIQHDKPLSGHQDQLYQKSFSSQQEWLVQPPTSHQPTLQQSDWTSTGQTEWPQHQQAQQYYRAQPQDQQQVQMINLQTQHQARQVQWQQPQGQHVEQQHTSIGQSYYSSSAQVQQQQAAQERKAIPDLSDQSQSLQGDEEMTPLFLLQQRVAAFNKKLSL